MRALQLRLVKTKNADAPPQNGHVDVTLEGKTAIIGHTVEVIVDKIAHAAVAYVLADTIRKVVIARFTRH